MRIQWRIFTLATVCVIGAAACPTREEVSGTGATGTETVTETTAKNAVTTTGPPDCEPPQSPRTHNVKVWVDRSEQKQEQEQSQSRPEVLTDPSPVPCVYPRDTVEWTTDDGELTITFSNPNAQIPGKDKNKKRIDHAKIKYTQGRSVATWKVPASGTAEELPEDFYDYLVTVRDKHDSNKIKKSDPEVDIREVAAPSPLPLPSPLPSTTSTQ